MTKHNVLIVKENILLSEYTTIKLGGAAKYFIECDSEDSVKDALKFAKEKKCRLQVLAGGSNIVFSDEGFDGLILKMSIKVVSLTKSKESCFITSGAGEIWDDFVKFSIENEFTGAECLSGIPGSVGATPVQNVGAYGQEVSEIIHSLKAIDKESLEVINFSGEECRFGYRDSRFKSADKDKYIILEVVFKMNANKEPEIRYPELKNYLESLEKFSALSDRKEKLNFIRNAVLTLRQKKSMIIDSNDPNSVSCGSFFTNPVLDVPEFEEFRTKCEVMKLSPPFYKTTVSGIERMKIPAAWLVEQSGFVKGFKAKGAGISSSHSLAIINTGGKTSDVLSLSGEIMRKVKEKFGITLTPEPVIVK